MMFESLSESDGDKKVFRGSIDHRWRQKKFSEGLSIIDGGKKSFPRGYRYPMEAKKFFRGSIGIRWRLKKFSTRLSESDGGKKSFPRGYRNPMEAKKVFHGAIGIRWRQRKGSMLPSVRNVKTCGQNAHLFSKSEQKQHSSGPDGSLLSIFLGWGISGCIRSPYREREHQAP